MMTSAESKEIYRDMKALQEPEASTKMVQISLPEIKETPKNSPAKQTSPHKEDNSTRKLGEFNSDFTADFVNSYSQP